MSEPVTKYAVWRRDGPLPSALHESALDAQAEAERLCRKEGVPFCLVEFTVLAEVACGEPPLDWTVYESPATTDQPAEIED